MASVWGWLESIQKPLGAATRMTFERAAVSREFIGFYHVLGPVYPCYSGFNNPIGLVPALWLPPSHEVAPASAGWLPLAGAAQGATGWCASDP